MILGFKDGKIIHHTDHFDIEIWKKQALEK